MHQRLHSEVWDHPPIWGVLAYVVLERIGIYVTHLQNTLAQYISTWKIFNNKVAEEKRPDLSALLRFCEKSGIGYTGCVGRPMTDRKSVCLHNLCRHYTDL